MMLTSPTVAKNGSAGRILAMARLESLMGVNKKQERPCVEILKRLAWRIGGVLGLFGGLGREKNGNSLLCFSAADGSLACWWVSVVGALPRGGLTSLTMLSAATMVSSYGTLRGGVVLATEGVPWKA